MSRKFSASIACLLLTLLCSAPSFAANVTVSNADQLQTALTAAEDNGEPDVITLESGIYSGHTFQYNGQENHGLTLKGPADQSAVLDGETARGVLELFTNDEALDDQAHVTVQNLTIINGRRTNQLGGGGLYIQTDNATVLVENCHFENNVVDHSFSFNRGGGFMTRVQEDGPVTLRRNTFINNTSVQGGGGGAFVFRTSGDIEGGEILIESNRFIGNTAVDLGGGLLLGNTDEQRSLVRNNVFYNNTLTSSAEPPNIAGGSGFASTGSNPNNSIVNNTIVGNTADEPNGCGMAFWNSGMAPIYNNILRDNLAGGANVDFCTLNGGAEGFTNFFNNDFGVAVQNDGTPCDPSVCGPGQQGNLSVDPAFANIGALDFHLLAGSPLIDQGSPNAPDLPATDIEGNPRSLGAAPDMGAFEAPEPSDMPAACGNDVIDGEEECDDGNTVSGDGCSSTCVVETAGPIGNISGGACSLHTSAIPTFSHINFLFSVSLLVLFRLRRH